MGMINSSSRTKVRHTANGDTESKRIVSLPGEFLNYKQQQ